MLLCCVYLKWVEHNNISFTHEKIWICNSPLVSRCQSWNILICTNSNSFQRLSLFEILFSALPELVICQNRHLGTVYALNCKLRETYATTYMSYSTIRTADRGNICQHDFEIDQSQWSHPLWGKLGKLFQFACWQEFRKTSNVSHLSLNHG